MDCSLPAPLSMKFSWQDYWSGLPFLSPGDLPNPGVEPWSPTLQTRALLTEPPGKPVSGPQGAEYLMLSIKLKVLILMHTGM